MHAVLAVASIRDKFASTARLAGSTMPCSLSVRVAAPSQHPPKLQAIGGRTNSHAGRNDRDMRISRKTRELAIASYLNKRWPVYEILVTAKGFFLQGLLTCRSIEGQAQARLSTHTFRSRWPHDRQ